MFYHVRASLAVVLLALNIGFWLIPCVIFAIIKSMISYPPIRQGSYNVMVGIATACIFCDSMILRIVSGVRIIPEYKSEVRKDVTYLVIANHRSWADVLILQRTLYDRTSLLKWLTKREMLKVPLIGFVCQAYEYPMMSRYTKQYLADHPEKREEDRDRIRRACEQLARNPGTLINFPEGTRYTHEKAERQQTPYRHLLKPRPGGVSVILTSMGPALAGVLDATLFFDDYDASFWEFLGGKVKTVRVSVRLRSVEDVGGADPEKYDTEIPQRLQALWREKDAELVAFLENNIN